MRGAGGGALVREGPGRLVAGGAAGGAVGGGDAGRGTGGARAGVDGEEEEEVCLRGLALLVVVEVAGASVGGRRARTSRRPPPPRAALDWAGCSGALVLGCASLSCGVALGLMVRVRVGHGGTARCAALVAGRVVGGWAPGGHDGERKLTIILHPLNFCSCSAAPDPVTP